MVLEETLSAEAWAELPDYFKEAYKQAQDGSYGLQHTGVSKLKESLDNKDRLLKEKDDAIARAQLEVAKFKDIDPDKARAAMAEVQELKKQKLLTKGDFDAALAAERMAWETDSTQLKEAAAAERRYVEKLLIDRAMREALTSGRTADGKPGPKVKEGLLEGAEEMLRARYKPQILELADDRQAVVDYNGGKMKLTDFLMGTWLPSETAKDWVIPPETQGARDGAAIVAGRPIAPQTTMSREAAQSGGVSLEQIASGEVAVSG